MKRSVVLGCLLPIIVLGGLGWWGYRKLTTKQPTPPRYATVDLGTVDIKVTETGSIEPLRKVDIKSKVAGRLSKLYVDEGDRVQAGQILAEIDPTEVNSQVEQIRAQLAGARARFEQARRGVTYQTAQTISSAEQAKEAVRTTEARLRVAEEEMRTQPTIVKSDIGQAEAGLASAEKALELLKSSTQPQALVQARTAQAEAQSAAEQAARELARRRKLLERGFASQQAVDAAISEAAAANARLEQAQKRLDLLATHQQIEMAEAESRVAQARAALERAKTGQTLLAVKNEEVAAARAALAQAKAQLRAAIVGVQQDKMRADDVAQARSSVTQIENQLREFEVRQHDTRLVSTMAGVVTKRYVEQGELITSGVSTFSSGTPVVQVADLSRMLVRASVNEVDVHKVTVGLPVEIRIDSARGVPFTGRVRKVSPSAIGAAEAAQAMQRGDGAVIRFAVEIEVTNPDARLKPGMSARCTVVVDRRPNVLRLPVDAVEGDGPKASVQVVHRTKKSGKDVVTFEKRPIVAGLRGDSFIEIRSGLKKGDQVKPGVYRGPKRKTIDLNFN